MKIGIATSAEVDLLWPAITGRIQEACERNGGDISSGDLWQMCRSGNAFLVLVMDQNGPVAALIMQFQNWSGKQVLRCLGIAGERMAEWLPMAKSFIEQMAKDGGAKSLVSDGREGWASIFPDARKLRVTYEIRID